MREGGRGGGDGRWHLDRWGEVGRQWGGVGQVVVAN